MFSSQNFSLNILIKYILIKKKACSVSSGYFTPADFVSAKISKNSFSILHLNIASLAKHIGELRYMLVSLDHPFDIIGLTETRLSNEIPISNVDIEGHQFVHTPTPSQCGGAAIYIKNGHQYEIINDHSRTIDNVSESVFIEIKNSNGKNIIIGCMYRHPSVTKKFIEYFLEPTLVKLSNQKKTCALIGDFNFDLLKYETHHETSNFYDILSSHSYRPLILHPTRVTSKTNTLIDNIFINDLACSSLGGNITSSISDHFLQFSQIDSFIKPKTMKSTKYARSYKKFNQQEFLEELNLKDWNNIKYNNDPDASLSLFIFGN